MTIETRSPAMPGRSGLVREARVVADVLRMTVPLVRSSLSKRRPEAGTLVIVVPGFGADDRYTAPLRHFLYRRGHDAEGWGLGKNLAGLDLQHSPEDLSPGWDIDRTRRYNGEASVPYLADRLTERVLARHADAGRPVSLVGWSLGGYLAREAARDLPEIVDRVITLGSPIIGGPKYTTVAPVFRKRGLDLDWIEEEVRKREQRPIRQPITAIYSRTDGIVDWGAALDHHSRNVTHVEVDAAHLGLAFNPAVWRIVLDALEKEVDAPDAAARQKSSGIARK